MKYFRFKKALCLSFVFLMLALLYIPILLLIIYSFTGAAAKGSTEIGAWNGFTFENYLKVFTNDALVESILNTLIVALSSAALATVIGTVTAVGLHSMRKRLRSVVNAANQITVINADIVTSVAFVLFFAVVFKAINIDSGYATLIIAHTVITTPFVILTVAPRLAQLNPNVYEAGLDLGAGPLRTLVTVVLPQLIPAMISGFALAFTLSLDDFVVTKYNNGIVPMLPTYLYNSLAKSSVPIELRAVSTLFFAVSLTILVAVNIYSRKKMKQSALNLHKAVNGAKT